QPPVIAAQNSSTKAGTSVTINLGLSDPDNNLDLTTLKIIAQPKSGAKASIDQSGRLVVDYTSITFVGEDLLTLEVCDLAGVCSQKVVQITVNETDVDSTIVVYNAISPNSDGKND